ncbi:MAG: T9SS type A sorting domain-containing protein [Bacteroidota bacterium]
MNRFHSLLTFCCILITTTAFAQLKFNVKATPDAYTYGVYVKICDATVPSNNTIAGTGQVTVVLPLGNNTSDLVSVGGVWQESGSVSGPDESPSKNYFSYGFLADSPKIEFEAGKESLLFTFKVEGGAVPVLIENDTDPFAVFPNSMNSNPGNEMSVLDVGSQPVGYYYYSGNYTDDDLESCNTEDDTEEPTDNPTSTSEENADGAYFNLSPNPTSAWINVEFNEGLAYENGTVQLTTVHGVKLDERDSGGQTKIGMNVSNLPNGLYFINLESDGQVVQRERFMKQ